MHEYVFVVRCTGLSLGDLRGESMIVGRFGLPTLGSHGQAECRFSQVYRLNFLLNFHEIFMEFIYVMNKYMFLMKM
ncbi:hypothetical protein WS70_13760 [Burkholderia mayonis]|uniref:Uncharacterized protein n=1 Tax=Burkholderia mayonis TaxID=1385591 RepID=A0A1B4FGD7_9BURK|nr:hypothetical protein WS70_13760 [Burkholderia mayonis]KVE45140.1 hypothetical protein WS70_05820 [Burkholderia mayonis]